MRPPFPLQTPPLVQAQAAGTRGEGRVAPPPRDLPAPPGEPPGGPQNCSGRAHSTQPCGSGQASPRPAAGGAGRAALAGGSHAPMFMMLSLSGLKNSQS